MTVRKLFDKGTPNSILAAKDIDELGEQVESADNISETLELKNRFIPQKNYADPKSFARYGSAEKYYEDSFNRIANSYPYDGSLKEKNEFLNESNYLDLYIFDNAYPRTTGYATISPNGWGTVTASFLIPTSVNVGKPNILEYVQVIGGPHTASGGMIGKELPNVFGDSNYYDPLKNRESNLKCNFDDGVTIEFWMLKSSGSMMTGSTDLEVPAMLSNGITGSVTIGLFTSGSTDPSAQRILFAANDDTTLVDYGGGGSAIPLSSDQMFDGRWHHYAFSVQNSASFVKQKVYFDGALIGENITAATLSEVTGALKLNVGAAREGTLTAGIRFPSDGFAKLSGSIDEFRYWKTARTSEEIGRYWFTQYGGGTNNDDANTDLGVYLKFNEGITGIASIDSVALDYSGRISNGTWVGYTEQGRSTGSAIDSYFDKESEFKEPIIYSDHPDVISKRSELISSGSAHDIYNNSSLYKSIPSWIIEEDDHSGQELLKLTQILSNYFDTLQLQIENYPRLKDIQYPGKGVKPLPFSYKLLEGYGLSTSEIFTDASILEQILNRSETETFDEDLTDIKNLIYQNIYNNLTYIYKSKGTMKPFRNLMRCYGIDSELVKINLYADNSTYEFKDNFETRSTRKKYVDFNDPNRFAGTIYQHGGGLGSLSESFISASGPTSLGGRTSISDQEKYTSFTLESEIIFPKKLPTTHPAHFTTDFLTSSLFGLHAADGADPSDFTWPSSFDSYARVYALREGLESNDVRFALHLPFGGPSGLVLTSSLFYDVYDNNKWNFALRSYPEAYGGDLVEGIAPGSKTLTPTSYIIELYGVNSNAGAITEEFTINYTLTDSFPNDSESSYLWNPKRIYAGAERTNFTGSTVQQTDVKLGSVRYWTSYLQDDVIKTHARDPENFGAPSPGQSTYLYPTSLSGVLIPQIETLALNWSFNTLTGSDSSGKFTVPDLSSGSAEKKTHYKWMGEVVGTHHPGRGNFFPPSSTKVLDTRFVYSGKQNTPENIHSSDMIFINESDDTFKLSARPQEYYFAIEKSMYQSISEEILNIFATITDFNTLVGDPVNRYRQEYKALGKLRQLFFENIQNTPDLDRYIEFYKWIDNSLSDFLLQFTPASAKFSDSMRTMVESHVLERNKYWTKFPTLDLEVPDLETGFKGINELTYNWEFGHAPVDLDENSNCAWWKNRAERTGSISSGDIDVDSNRQKYLDASLSALSRKFTTPLNLVVEKRANIHGGTNFESNKSTNYIKDVLKVGSSDGIFITSDNVETEACKDNVDVTKTKLKYRSFTNDSAVNPSNNTFAKGEYYTPFTMYSSSNPQGFDQTISTQLGHNLTITNLHDDNYGSNFGAPLQGPFTDKFVGGLQRRHVDFNASLSDQNTRPEGFKLLEQSSRLKVSRVGAALPRAIYFREELAKRPLNIRNIKASGTIDPYATTQYISGTLVSSIGNYKKDYQMIQAPGRYINNRAWAKNGPWDLYPEGVHSHFVRSPAFQEDFASSIDVAVWGEAGTDLREDASGSGNWALVFRGGLGVGRHAEINQEFTAPLYVNFSYAQGRFQEGISSPGYDMNRPQVGEDFMFLYSTDNGSTWLTQSVIERDLSKEGDDLYVAGGTGFLESTVYFPEASGNVKFRWQQDNYTGFNVDNWALNRVTIVEENTRSSIPKIERGRNEHILVSRFSAPGDPLTMGDSNGGPGLDRYSAELSPYNDLNTRNQVVRRPLNRQTLTNHISAYNSSSPYNVNKNPRFFMNETSPGVFVTSSKFDNYWVQHAIPATDLAYSWITSSYSSVSPSGFGYWYTSQFWGNNPPVHFYLSGADSYNSIPVDFVEMNNLVYEPVQRQYTTFFDNGEEKFIPEGCWPSSSVVPFALGSSPTCAWRQADDFDFNTITSYRNPALASVPTTDLFNVLTNKRNKGKAFSSWRQIRSRENPTARFLKRNNLYQLTRADHLVRSSDEGFHIYSEDEAFPFFVHEPPVDIQGGVSVGFMLEVEAPDILCSSDNLTPANEDQSSFTELQTSFGEVNYFSTDILNKKVSGSPRPKILYPDSDGFIEPSKGSSPFAPECARSGTPYGIITDLYLKGATENPASPVRSFVEMTYESRVYPTKNNLTSKVIRYRPNYFQTFWKNDRHNRTLLGDFKFNSNSQGFEISQSAWALDAVEDFVNAPIYNATNASTGAAGELQNDYSQCFSSSLFPNGWALSCSYDRTATAYTDLCDSGSIPPLTSSITGACWLQYGMVVAKDGASFQGSALPPPTEAFNISRLRQQARWFSEYAVGGALAPTTVDCSSWMENLAVYSDDALPFPSFPSSPTVRETYLEDRRTPSVATTNREFTVSTWIYPEAPTAEGAIGPYTIVSFEDSVFSGSDTGNIGSVKLCLIRTGEPLGTTLAISASVTVHTPDVDPASPIYPSPYYVDQGATNDSIDLNEWYNITMCYQSPAYIGAGTETSDRLKIFVDGVEWALNPSTTGSTTFLTLDEEICNSYIAASTCSVGNDATFTRTNQVLLWDFSEYAERVFNGLIDETSIFNYSLYSKDPANLAPIQFLYNNGKPKDLSSISFFQTSPQYRPLSWWRYGDEAADQEGISSVNLPAATCSTAGYGKDEGLYPTFDPYLSASTSNAVGIYFGSSPYSLYSYCMADGYPIIDFSSSYLDESEGLRAIYFMDYKEIVLSSSLSPRKQDLIVAPIYNRKHCLESIFSVTHYGWSPPAIDPVDRSLTLPIAEISGAAAEWETKWSSPATNIDFLTSYPLGKIQDCGGSALWEAGRLAGRVVDGAFISKPQNPFSDSYDIHMEDARLFNKEYTVVPEFRISEQIEKYFDNGMNMLIENPSQFEIVGIPDGANTPGNSSDDSFYKIYSNSDFLEHFSMIKEDHKNFADPTTISLKCDAIMRFLPYEGFYPSERALQLAGYFSRSYGEHIDYRGPDSVYTNIRMRPFLAPFFRPGLMFNAIKSGLAVDYPVYTQLYDVVEPISYDVGPTASSYHLLGRQSTATATDDDGGWDYRVPFEALVDPYKYVAKLPLYDLEPCPSSALDVVATWTGDGDGLYSRAMSNYLAAIPEFFLPEGRFTSLTSKPEKDFATVVSGTTYGMRVKLRKTMNKERIWRTVTSNESALTYDLPQNPRILNGDTEGLQETFTLYSRPSAFGPPVAAVDDLGFSTTILPTGLNAAYNKSLYPSDSLMGINPSFTPPYYDGECWADIIFTPKETGRASIDDIFANSKVNYWRIDTLPNPNGVLGATNDLIGTIQEQAFWSGGQYPLASTNNPMSWRFANAYAMQLDASVNFFGKIGDKWIIEPKFETPHYNFNNTSVRPIDAASGTLTIPTNGSESVPRGMWHQFGTIETEKGIYLETDTLPEEWLIGRSQYTDPASQNPIEMGGKVDLSLYNTGTFESLSDLVGFENSKKLGSTAESLTVSEAIVAIPFIEVDGKRNFFEIPEKTIRNALGLVSNETSVLPSSRAANAATSAMQGLNQVVDDLLETEEEKSNAKSQAVAIAAANAAADSILNEDDINKPSKNIIEMVRKMKKYVFPPNMDFVKNLGPVKPYAMYIFEFEYTFDQDDLAHIWQNVAPPMKDKKFTQQEAKISHKLLANEFMGNFGNGEYNPMEDRVQWMVFKVKQRANNNYFSKVSAESGENTKQHNYSYNWPYDFFSLVEFAKVSTKVGFGKTIPNDTNEQEVAETNTNPGKLTGPVGKP